MRDDDGADRHATAAAERGRSRVRKQGFTGGCRLLSTAARGRPSAEPSARSAPGLVARRRAGLCRSGGRGRSCRRRCRRRHEPDHATHARAAVPHPAREPAQRQHRSRALARGPGADRGRPRAGRGDGGERPLPLAPGGRPDRSQRALWRPDVAARQPGRRSRDDDLERRRRLGRARGRLYPGRRRPRLQAGRQDPPAPQRPAHPRRLRLGGRDRRGVQCPRDRRFLCVRAGARRLYGGGARAGAGRRPGRRREPARFLSAHSTPIEITAELDPGWHDSLLFLGLGSWPRSPASR